MIEAWFRLVLRNRGRVILVLAAITALAGLSTSRGVLSSSLQQLFFGESVEYAAWLDRARSFGGAESVVVGYSDPDPFSVHSLERLERATTAIATLHDIQTTRSLLDAPWVRAETLSGTGRPKRSRLPARSRTSKRRRTKLVKEGKRVSLTAATTTAGASQRLRPGAAAERLCGGSGRHRR